MTTQSETSAMTAHRPSLILSGLLAIATLVAACGDERRDREQAAEDE